jgi:hypothetical protein
LNNETLLLRQVSPGWLQKGRVTSQLFRPTPKDKGMISVYDGDQITPEAAWTHFTNVLGLQSEGVLAVTLQECRDHEIPAIPSPKEFQEHVLLDFRAFSRNQTQNLAKRLTQYANARGWQYRS